MRSTTLTRFISMVIRHHLSMRIEITELLLQNRHPLLLYFLIFNAVTPCGGVVCHLILSTPLYASCEFFSFFRS